MLSQYDRDRLIGLNAKISSLLYCNRDIHERKGSDRQLADKIGQMPVRSMNLAVTFADFIEEPIKIIQTETDT